MRRSASRHRRTPLRFRVHNGMTPPRLGPRVPRITDLATIESLAADALAHADALTDDLMTRGAHWDSRTPLTRELTRREATDALRTVRTYMRALAHVTLRVTRDTAHTMRALATAMGRLQLLEDIYLSWLDALPFGGLARLRARLTDPLARIREARALAALRRAHAEATPPRLAPDTAPSAPRAPARQRLRTA